MKLGNWLQGCRTFACKPQKNLSDFLETYSFLTAHARTQTHISKKRLTPVEKYSHAASEVALLRTQRVRRSTFPYPR